MLVVVSGLPGVGKTTIARELACATGAVYVRIDSIEQGLRAAGWQVDGEHASGQRTLTVERIGREAGKPSGELAGCRRWGDARNVCGLD